MKNSFKSKFVLITLFITTALLFLLFVAACAPADTKSDTAGDALTDAYSSENSVSQSDDNSLQSTTVDANSTYNDLLKDIVSETPSKKLKDYMSYFLKDIDGDGTDELCVMCQTEMTVYTYRDKSAINIGSHDFITGTFRLFSSENTNYPGIFYFTVGGSAEHYCYITIKNEKLTDDRLWVDHYACEELGYPERTSVEYTSDKNIIDESKKLYEKDEDIERITFSSMK